MWSENIPVPVKAPKSDDVVKLIGTVPLPTKALEKIVPWAVSYQLLAGRYHLSGWETRPAPG